MSWCTRYLLAIVKLLCEDNVGRGTVGTAPTNGYNIYCCCSQLYYSSINNITSWRLFINSQPKTRADAGFGGGHNMSYNVYQVSIFFLIRRTFAKKKSIILFANTSYVKKKKVNFPRLFSVRFFLTVRCGSVRCKTKNAPRRTKEYGDNRRTGVSYGADGADP